MAALLTSTDRRTAPCHANFDTLVEALDYAAGAATGMNFHGPRGDLCEVLSYARLAREAREAGARLLGLGLEPGDRVGLVAETNADFVRAFMGAVISGLVPCPMPLPAAFSAKSLYGEQIRRIAEVAEVSAVILDEPYRPLVADALADRHLAYLGPLAGIDAAPQPLPAPPAPDAIAYLQFSSGTTRAPRGIVVTHRALMANIRGMATHALGIGPEDRGVSWLPFYHDMGLVGTLLLPVGTQMSVDYLATRDFVRRPGLWPVLISRGGGTVSYAPSFGYQLAAQRARFTEPLDLSSWRVAGIGGDIIRSANLEQFAQVYAPHGFRRESFLPSYGMAELTLGFTFGAPGAPCRAEIVDAHALERGVAELRMNGAPASRAFVRCGTPLPEHEVEIRDDAGRPLGERRVGRVFARGPSVMSGYFRDAQATAAVLSPDGWLETGDKGYLAEGELVITGRSKDLIIVNGRNLWPQDIEWTLEDRLRTLREGSVAAFGLEQQDDEGLAVVLEHPGNDGDARESLRRECETLVREVFGLRPQILFSRVGQLPRTSSGKLSRARAREMCQAGQFDG